MDLARWLVARRKPAHRRAVVNRLWKQFFGNGLSGIVEDLGSQGEWPSHPELLDWLAVEFRDSGWDMKHIVRLMVTSAAYRQDSSLRGDCETSTRITAGSASQNPRRLEAEFVRDNVLSIAGLINLDIGGPKLQAVSAGRILRQYSVPRPPVHRRPDEREYRRGLYMHWQRTFLHPMLANFDAPCREDCVCTRDVSNTPQQALTLLNDPECVEAAKALAVRVACRTEGRGPFGVHLPAGFGSIDPAQGSRFAEAVPRVATKYFKAHATDAGKLLKIGLFQVPAGDDPIELAAWTSVCRVVLNLHETITRY